MPLLKNTNQPFFPDPNSPAERNCNGAYCYPVNSGDTIYQQWYQTPCGNNEISDPTFSDYTLGAEMITNGSFTGSAAGWTLGGNWAYGTNDAACTNGMISELEQSGIGLMASTMYRITFDLTRTAGALYVAIDAGPGPASSAYFDETGSYSIDLYNPAGPVVDKIRFITDTDFAGTIDNVSMKPITFAGWIDNDTWNFEDNMACATAYGTSYLTESVADYISAGGYYQMTVTVSNYVAGSLIVRVANVTDVDATVITGNGDYTLYFEPTLTGVVSFEQSADFVGCVSSPDLRELRNDYIGYLVDEEGNQYGISQFFEYWHDKVTINNTIFDSLGLEYGCYTFELTDSCEVEGNELVVNGNFAGGVTGWTRNNGSYQYSFAGGEVQFIFDPLQGSNLITNGDFSSGSAGWTFAGWTIGTDAAHNTGNTSSLSRSVTIVTPPSPPAAPLYTWIYLTLSGRTAGSFTVTLGGTTSLAYSSNGTFAIAINPVSGGSVTFSINPTSTFDGTFDDIEIYQTTQTQAQSPVLYNTINPEITDGNYSMSFDITDITSVGLGSVAISGGVVGQSQALVRKKTVGTHTVSITGYTPGLQLPYLVPEFAEVDPAGGTRSYPGTMSVDNVSLVRVEPFEATYTSECMNYQEAHDNTFLVTGYCDQDSFDLNFSDTGFYLQMRLEIRGLNPVYDKVKNISQFGNGNARVAYAELTKFWQLTTAYMSESAHDAFAAIIDCDHFIIGTPGGNGIEYVASPEDYQPAWTQNGTYALAPVTIAVRLKTNGQKYNRHT